MNIKSITIFIVFVISLTLIVDAQIDCKLSSKIQNKYLTEKNNNKQKGDINMGDYTYTQTCNANFYDSGGPTAFYGYDEDYTMTVEPAESGKKIQVEFSAFYCGVQGSGYDYLEIYDGTSTSADLLVSSDDVGNDGMLDVFRATNPNGALTFYFHSSGVCNYEGWEAVISCYSFVGHDLGAEYITPTGTIAKNTTISPKVTIYNYGTNDENAYEVTLVSDIGGYNETVSNPGNINSYGNLVVEFPDWTISEGTYSLTATVTLSGDENPANDNAYTTLNVSELNFGQIVKTFETEENGCPGIETDGEYIYTVYWNSETTDRHFDKYNIDGVFLEEFEVIGAEQVRDMAFNTSTGYFYGAAADDTLWEMDFDNQNLVKTINIPTQSRAICYDTDDNTFWANNYGTPLKEFDITGSATGNSFNTPNIYGAAYDNWSDPDNPTIWGFEGTNFGETPSIVEYNLDGSTTGREIDCSMVPGYVNGIAGGLASFELDGHGYLLANIQQNPNLIVVFYLSAPNYMVNFNVDDGNNPIEGANIYIDDQELTTDNSGSANIYLKDGTYDYFAIYQYCDNYSGELTVSGEEETVDISMNCDDLYTVTFNVEDDNSNPIPAANVTIPDLSVDDYTNVDGELVISEVPAGTYDYTVNATSYPPVNDQFEVVDQNIIVDVVLTGLSENKSNIAIYPNPNSGKFNINLDEIYEINISDISGKTIYTDLLKSNINKIDLTEQKTGVYFIKLKSETKTFYHKIIIQ